MCGSGRRKCRCREIQSGKMRQAFTWRQSRHPGIHHHDAGHEPRDEQSAKHDAEPTMCVDEEATCEDAESRAMHAEHYATTLHHCEAAPRRVSVPPTPPSIRRRTMRSRMTRRRCGVARQHRACDVSCQALLDASLGCVLPTTRVVTQSP